MSPALPRACALAALLLLWLAPALLAGPRQLAVVISAAHYAHLPDLPNAGADAAGVAASLRRAGYRTVVLQPQTRSGLLRQLARLRLAAADAQQVVVYYAGHGLQSGGRAYMLLPGFAPGEDGRQQEMVPVSALLKAFSDRPRQKIILFDACRSPPALAGLKPFADAAAPLPAGALLAFASQPGAPAWDGAAGNGPFAAALMAELGRGPQSFETLLRRVRIRVVAATGGLQVPWQRSALLREALLPAAAVPP